MKKASILLLVALMLIGCSSQGKEENKDIYKIGVLQLIEHPSLDATLEGLKEKLDETLGADKYELIIKNAQGEAVNANTIAKQFVSDDVDLIYAIATLSAQASLNATSGTKIPVVFNAVTDPVEAGLVTSLQAPGSNVTGVTDAAPIQKQLELIKEVMPQVESVGLIYNVGEVNSTVQVKQAQDAAKKVGLTLDVVGITQANELQVAAQQVASRNDAVYTITDNMVVAGMATLVDQANRVKVPVFAAEDGQFDKGLLATESISYKDLGRVAADMVRAILVDGVKPEALSVRGADETTLILSKTVAEKLGIEIPQSVLERATFR